MSRPLIFETPEELEKKIKEYFDDADMRGVPYTVEMLSVFLDVDRKTLINYKNREKFFPVIKKAMLKIQANHVEQGLSGQTQSAFAIFIGKNNFGYTNKEEVELKANVTQMGTVKVGGVPVDFNVGKSVKKKGEEDE